MPGQRRKPDRPILRGLLVWGIPIAVTVLWALSTPGIAPASRATVTAALVATYVLGGIGQIACIWAQWITMHRWEPATDDDHRLRVLTGQASVAALVGLVANHFWGETVVGLPVVVSLVAVVTMRDGAEAFLLAVKVRNRYYQRLPKRTPARHGEGVR
ncbi:hypothetical protein GCM10009613_05530 [Pseudonocardia kongjuensis]|uniref:Uncharacterized protein n=1 Tax=Pseudonocardia kongjuensis TaxID=102227 RepID=A0ABP4I450_9PSEU